MQFVKSLKGHSKSTVGLYYKKKKFIVIKEGQKNLGEAARILKKFSSLGIKTPLIEIIKEDEIHMEYINGCDMQQYIQNASKVDLDKLIEFINDYYKIIISEASQSDVHDMSDVIESKLRDISKINFVNQLDFSLAELYDLLPKTSRLGLVHGDFTLDNILYKDNNFYLIDSNPTNINSLFYDANKIRQDIDCFWFIRDQQQKKNYSIACAYMSKTLKQKWKFLCDDYILIFMLLRIFPYCNDKKTKEFLITEVNRLWQS